VVATARSLWRGPLHYASASLSAIAVLCCGAMHYICYAATAAKRCWLRCMLHVCSMRLLLAVRIMSLFVNEEFYHRQSQSTVLATVQPYVRV
jgi:hypothetical protein